MSETPERYETSDSVWSGRMGELRATVNSWAWAIEDEMAHAAVRTKATPEMRIGVELLGEIDRLRASLAQREQEHSDALEIATWLTRIGAIAEQITIVIRPGSHADVVVETEEDTYEDESPTLLLALRAIATKAYVAADYAP